MVMELSMIRTFILTSTNQLEMNIERSKKATTYNEVSSFYSLLVTVRCLIHCSEIND